jgi:isopentenyl diphosphate isomerase/L-lactate dehydrogenase-like FMN-dependent dehydrogenase
MAAQIEVSREWLQARATMPRKVVAAELGCTTRTVTNLMQRHGLIEINKAHEVISREFLQAHLWMQQQEMAKELGVSQHQVYVALHHHGLHGQWMRNRMAKDNGCPCGKVDPQRCRELCAAGQPVLCEVKR